jgi:DNA-binding transcriptional LysR family regulator
MNLDLYNVFYHVAKIGSITKAAEELFITQPTVSYFIKQLEEKLGITLFIRKSKGVSLTEEGKVLYKYIEESLNLIRIGEKKIEQLRNLHSGLINIGISETLCKYYLLPKLEYFHQQYPDIRIRLSHGKSAEIISNLIQGNIDFGIVPSPITEKNIAFTEVFTLQDTFITGEKFKSLRDSSVSLEQLSHYPMITLSENSNIRNFLTAIFKNNGFSVVPEIELGSIDLLKEFTRIGFGISLVPKIFIMEELNKKVLYEINVHEDISPRKIGIIHLKDTPLSIASKEFIKELI